MSTIEIRPASPAHYQTIDDLLEAAFKGGEEVDIVHRIRARGLMDLELVAVLDGEPVGHVAFSAVRLDPPGPAITLTGLAPLAVHPDVQNQGIGKKLVWAGIDRLRKRGLHAMFILGDPGYYGHFGFRLAAPSGLACVYPGGEKAFQVLELFDGALAEVRGTVHYLFDESA